LSPETQSARGNGRFTKPPTRKLAQRLDDKHDRLPLLPLGRLHPYQACAYCGAGPPEVELERKIIGLTYAEGVMCTDLSECLRRRLRRVA
jgi:hypothetical protein